MAHTDELESESGTGRDQGLCVAVIDTETATSDPASACSVGWSWALFCEGGWSAERGDSVLVRPPGNLYAERNIEVHGITPDETADAGCLMDSWTSIVRPALVDADARWLSAYNASFDGPVLWASLAATENGSGREAWHVRSALRDPDGEMWRLACLLGTARRHVPEDAAQESFKLSELCAHLGIEVSSWHDASNDSFAAAQVLCWILNQSELDMPSLVDEAYGAWFRFGRNGPEPEERLVRSDRQSGVLTGVTSDGRLHHQALDVAPTRRIR